MHRCCRCWRQRCWGIAQTMACRQYGIDVFLVPEGNQEEALIYAGEMMVIGVCSVFEALTILTDLNQTCELLDTLIAGQI